MSLRSVPVCPGDVPASEGVELRDPDPLSKKVRGKGHIYDLKETFNTKDEAEQYLTSQLIWSKTSSTNTEEGVKVYLRCNQVPKTGTQCSAVSYLLYRSYV